jgi:hypothetical protein
VVDFSWTATQPPAQGVAPSTYGIRWEGTLVPKYTETYTFSLTSDDGARVIIGGTTVVDDYAAHALRTKTGSIALTAGQAYPIKLTYFQQTATGAVKLEWASVHQPLQVVPVDALYPKAAGPGTGLTASYYKTATLTQRVVKRIDPLVAWDWGTGAPVAGAPTDAWSVRWEGFIQPDFSETYQFSTEVSTGVRLYVDDVLVIDDWNTETLRTKTGSIALVAGNLHRIRLEVNDASGGARVRLLWKSPSEPLQQVPTAQLYRLP